MRVEKKKKKQLQLVFFPKKGPLTLPEGYTVTNYTGEADIMPWIEICKNGLALEDAGRAFFDACITNFPCIDPYRDIFFLETGGEKVATITAINDWNGMGRIHMVSVAASQRGKGLSHILSRIAENKLADAGVKIGALTTDDWRKPACKCYLRNGCFPVNHDTDMPERWRALITEFGIDSIQMYTENGEKDIVIYANQ